MAPRKGSGVEPCSNELCRFPTRPDRRTLTDMPNTRKRIHGMCQRCYERANPKPAKETDRSKFIPLGEPDPHVIAGLNSFLARRQARETAAARAMYPGMAQRRNA